jgi:polyferredoxin
MVLGRIGPTWQAAPVRRFVQAACLLLYLHLFFVVSWPYAGYFSGQTPTNREWTPVELFLWLDPLVGLSTAIAARWWNLALLGMAAVLALGLLFQRAFCGYLCPMGTLIDLFDFLIGNRLPRFKTQVDRHWASMRFCILAVILGASFGGVLLSGFAAAIPVLTRGLLFSAGNAQLGLAKNWGMVPPMTGGVWLSLVLFAGVFILSLVGPRFWCRYICPSGALLSLPGLFSRFQRHVDDHCLECRNCIRACPYDAVEPDFGTRVLNCAFCQTCGGICPSEAIQFVWTSAAKTRCKPVKLSRQQ